MPALSGGAGAAHPSIGLMETMADVLELPIIETLKPLAGADHDRRVAAAQNSKKAPPPPPPPPLLDGRHDIVVLAQDGMVEGMRWFELRDGAGRPARHPRASFAAKSRSKHWPRGCPLCASVPSAGWRV